MIAALLSIAEAAAVVVFVESYFRFRRKWPDPWQNFLGGALGANIQHLLLIQLSEGTNLAELNWIGAVASHWHSWQGYFRFGRNRKLYFRRQFRRTWPAPCQNLVMKTLVLDSIGDCYY